MTGRYRGGADAPLRTTGASKASVIVCGDAEERRSLRAILEFEGHHVSESAAPGETLRQIRFGFNDVLVAGARVAGPGLHEFCRAVRRQSDLGIIVVAGRDAQQDRIDALNAGADHTLESPFEAQELLAHVRAVLRRVPRSGGASHNISLGNRTIDFNAYEIRGPGGCVQHLTPKEFLVLRCLASGGGKPCSSRYLARTVWQRDGDGELEYLRVVVRQLRRKLEPEPFRPRYLLTERRIGYRLQSAAIPGCRTDSPARVRSE